ncbi:MAG TPA: serine/threonine-protein kinase, partial [Kofleriaceae bacterium]
MAERTIGNYILGPILGRGGTSSVHAAAHRFLGDPVAIKLLRDHLASDPDATAAFLAEATRTRAIVHPNVVRVLDFGSDGDDLYLVMERLEGESLATRLARSRWLDEPTVRRLGAAIADGLAAAHARGIVHRDLKPGNIMLPTDPDGAPKVVDFGIARGSATVTGSRVGTLAYMAPEQLAGGLVAPCNDVWSLGVVLFEALTGQLPFEDFDGGRTPQLVDLPPRLGSLTEVSPALDALVAACLARDPGQRPASMQAVAAALRAPVTDQRFTEELPSAVGAAQLRNSGRDPAAPPAAAPGARRRGRRMLALATAIVVIAAIGIGLSRQLHEDRAPVRLPPLAGSAAPSAGSAAPFAGSAAPSAGSAALPAVPAVPAISPVPARTTVEVRSVPPGAAILVDGVRVGVTPATLPLALPASIVVT